MSSRTRDRLRLFCICYETLQVSPDLDEAVAQSKHVTLTSLISSPSMEHRPGSSTQKQNLADLRSLITTCLISQLLRTPRLIVKLRVAIVQTLVYAKSSQVAIPLCHSIDLVQLLGVTSIACYLRVRGTDVRGDTLSCISLR